MNIWKWWIGRLGLVEEYRIFMELTVVEYRLFLVSNEGEVILFVTTVQYLDHSFSESLNTAED